MTNNLEKDYDRALWRARNIASPLNAKRVGTIGIWRGIFMKHFDYPQLPEELQKGLNDYCKFWEQGLKKRANAVDRKSVV